MEPIPGDDGLDALMAEMLGPATETADQLQGCMAKLIDAVNHGANAVWGTGPQGGQVQPVVVLDSVQYDTLGPGRLNFGVMDSTYGGIVELIIRCGGDGFNTLNLETHVSTINNAYRQSLANAPIPAVSECEGKIVQQLIVCQPSLAALRALLEDETLDVPSPQAAAVIRFHETYPLVRPQLMQAKVLVSFNSSRSDGRGGGLFDNNTIYLSKLLITPAGAFVRLYVHEIGHALFEAKLLDGKAMPYFLATDNLADLPRQQSALWDRSQQCQEIQLFWDNMSDLAKTLYQAWRRLRRDYGAQLLGIDLWEDPRRNRLSPEQRRRYQAGNFGEFCAEVFMLYAMGDLQAHVLAILASDIDEDVQTAWKNAWYVLQTVAAPILA
jgi:hypothetical protein